MSGKVVTGGLTFTAEGHDILVEPIRHVDLGEVTLYEDNLKHLGFVPVAVSEKDMLRRAQKAREILREVCLENGDAYRVLAQRADHENGLDWILVIVIFGDPREWPEPWIVTRMKRIAAEAIWAGLGSCNDEDIRFKLIDKCGETGLNPVECIMKHGDPREWS